MRKNCARKLLHAILDLLPILIIPIFAININQKSVEPISIEVQEKVSVDFNQLRQNEQNYTNIGINLQCDNSAYTISGTATRSTTYSARISQSYTIANHKYYYQIHNYINAPTLYMYSFSNKGSGSAVNVKSFNQYNDDVGYIWTATQDDCSFELGINTNTGTTYNSEVFINIYDLTQMGLENTTMEEFNTLFPNQFYSYTESQKMLVNKPSPTTYNSTDIGSQFLYSLYKPINDYFNFNNLFNMNDVWNWIQLNLFQGTAPLPVFMVWNIIVYEFFMDLIFLLYSVFMFIIDFSTGMIDSFLYKSRKGV